MSDAPPPEILSLIEQHIEGFNTQNLEIFHSVFAADAIIIDGIAPYRWLNPDGPAKWLADVEKWRESLGVTYEICRTRWDSRLSRDRLRMPLSLGP